MTDLLLLNSERKQLNDHITELVVENSLIYGNVLRKITRIVNTADFLSEEAKEELLKLIWEK